MLYLLALLLNIRAMEVDMIMKDFDKMTQTEAILYHLKRGNAITPIGALTLCGCFRLGARIWELKQQGYEIETKFIKTKTGKHVAQYRLKGTKNEN
jgi:hypothetical protein